MDHDGTNRTNDFWKIVVSRTFEMKPKKFVFLKDDKNSEFSPDKCSFLEWSVGELKGQLSNWRASVQGTEEGFHALEYENRFECHIDKWDPAKHLWLHLSEDSPSTLGIIFGTVAAILGGISTYYFVKDHAKKKRENDRDKE